MSWTKRKLITEAFAEVGLASYVFDLQPEELQTAVRRMDTMMATWEANGVRVGYNFTSDDDATNLDADSGLPERALETVYLNLAKRIAPGFGKTLSPDTIRNARDGYDSLLTAVAMPIEQQLPGTMPRGAGNKPWRWQNPFFPQPAFPPVQVTSGPDVDILPE